MRTTPRSHAWWLACCLFAAGCTTIGQSESDLYGEDDGSALLGDERAEDASAFSKAGDRLRKLVGLGSDESVARAAFARGEKLYLERDFAAAADQFKVAYKRWPDSDLEERAQFMAAESSFFADRYVAGDDGYALLIKKHAGTQHLDVSLSRRFAIAQYWEKHSRANPRALLSPNFTDSKVPRFDTGGHAMKIYENIYQDDPTGSLADDCVMAIANAHFMSGRYEDADYYYTVLRTEYSKSDHQYQAHLLGLQAKIRKYQGAEYDGKPLEEAERLAGQLMSRFGQELGDEREEITRTQARIQGQLAKRDWTMAEYYDNGENYGAARIYYRDIVKKFPGSERAVAARQRLAQLDGEPDVPDEPYAWLVEMFPSETRPRPILATRPTDLK